MVKVKAGERFDLIHLIIEKISNYLKKFCLLLYFVKQKLLLLLLYLRSRTCG